MKKIEDVCFIIQARLNSKRMPNKMILPFGGSTLLDIVISKLVNSKLIPNENVYVALYDDELKNIASKYPVNIFHRSDASVSETKEPRVVSEWSYKLKHKWFITVNACAPLLSVDTINEFVSSFLNSNSKSMFAVHRTKNFYWDSSGTLITKYPGSLDTKLVDVTFEAAHCLYAGNKEDLSNNIYLGDFTPNYPELYDVHPSETIDIDEEWQFKAAEVLYNNIEKLK